MSDKIAIRDAYGQALKALGGRNLLCTLGALVMCTAPVFAPAANKQEKSEFNPHWFMQVQAGASYTLGEEMCIRDRHNSLRYS